MVGQKPNYMKSYYCQEFCACCCQKWEKLNCQMKATAQAGAGRFHMESHRRSDRQICWNADPGRDKQTEQAPTSLYTTRTSTKPYPQNQRLSGDSRSIQQNWVYVGPGNQASLQQVWAALTKLLCEGTTQHCNAHTTAKAGVTPVRSWAGRLWFCFKSTTKKAPNHSKSKS